MALHLEIKNQIKEAMKAKDEIRLLALRNIVTACTNELVAQRKTPQDTLEDDQVINLIRRLSKQRKDSIDQFTQAGRLDLVEGEQKELVILEEFLPALLSVEALRPLVAAKKEALGITDKKDMGKLLGALMADLKGTADGADVKKVAAELLG